MEENPTITGEFTGRYTIERELGRGGAAIVYLARDNRQERQVAVKVLHRELGQAIGAQRFLREIKHSSSLQHPHLLTILDSGESRGNLYYVMPYMADGSLRTRIAREKQLPVDDALRITRDVGEALMYAHSRGIVHRDIKPDNVLFSAEHACLADFGIARAVDSVAADTLTSTGLVVGTPAYMSPEQASGEKSVDARSDQYSLACLLYEMITGLPPFIGATQQSVISQRFTQPPPSMRAHRPNVPEHVERAVKRALAIVPADRFPSVEDFLAALHDPGGVPAPVSVHKIRRRWFAVGAAAVLATLVVMAPGPGKNWVRGALGTDVDTAKFVVLPFVSDDDPALGKRIASGVHAALSEWSGLGVAGDIEVRDALAEAGGEIGSLRDAVAIARSVGAGRLVWGTVSSEREQLRVVAHVYDLRRSAEIVARSQVAQAGAIGDSVFHALANALLDGGSLPARYDDGYAGSRSYPALQAYRRGVAALAQSDLERARDELSGAVDLDPEFAIAHLELARVQSWLAPTHGQVWQGHARRAVELQSELRPRDAIRAAALLAYARDDYAAACTRYKELISTDTLDARAWYGLAECMHADTVVVPDPRSPSGFSFRSSWHTAGNAFRRAVEVESALHAVPHSRLVTRLFPTDRNRIRTGATTAREPRSFAAVPVLVADTLAFTPYPLPNWEREDDDVSRERRSRALARNRQVILELTSGWVTAYPRSAEAHSALAALQEQAGQLASAAHSLAMARGFARDDSHALLLSDALARVRYKSGDFAGAVRIADSALTMFRETTPANWEPVARLAGLNGAVSRLGDALQFFWFEYQDVAQLDQAVTTAAGTALARAAVGICDGRPPAIERPLSARVRIHVPPDRHREVSDNVVSYILSFATPCAEGRAVGSIGGRGLIASAQRAFGSGDIAGARTLLDSAVKDRSHLRQVDISPTTIAREAFLRLALGDTAKALILLDGTLDGLGTIPASTMQHPLESATLVRMMATRAELAARAGDRRTARKWAQGVAVLWADADPDARPIRNRMIKLAAAGPWQ